jgi:Ca2+:H+ antiporter
VALRAGLYDLVKASITGSIIGNILLVFGLSALLGGARRDVQKFNATAASLGSTLLVLSAIGLLIPAIYHRLDDVQVSVERTLSFEIAIVLMVTYVLSLIFTLKTHKHLYTGGGHAVEHEPGHVPTPVWRSVALLLVATAGIALMSETLVGAVEEAAEQFHMNEVFVGVILVAIIGNAAEHSTAILMALKNRMDAAVSIAVGSSIQVALFVAPLLLFLSYFIGPRPLDLIFTQLEVYAVGIAVAIMAFITTDGESHWMEGVQLLAVYIMLGMAFYFLPV